MADSTKRSVHFYRAISRDRDDNVLPFDPAAILQAIQALPNSIDGRSLQINDKTRLTADVASVDPPRLRFGKAQLADLPYEETKELEWHDLPIRAGSGTADLIHVAFYPNNIVGHIYNHRGPHISRLASFIEMRCSLLVPYILGFHPLLRRDALREIMAMDTIRSVEFTVDGGAGDDIDNARGAKGLMQAARDIGKIGRPFTIGVKIGRIQDTDSVKQAIEDVATNRKLHDSVRQVRVHGSNYYQDDRKKRRARRETVDLLSADYVFEESILTYGNNKLTLDDTAAFAVMDAIYTKQRELLEQAKHIE